MNERHRVRITVTPHSQGTVVFLDDREICDLVAVTVRAAVNEPATVILEFRAVSVEIEGDVGKVETWGRKAAP